MKKKKLNRDKIAQHITNVMLEKHSEEEKEFKEWMATNAYAMNIAEGLSDSKNLNKKLNNLKYPYKEKDALLLIGKIERIQKRRRFVFSGVAAIVAAVFFLSMILWYDIPSKKQSITVVNENISVLQETPMLILSNGNTIELNQIGDTISIDGTLKSADISKIAPQISSSEKGELIVPSKCTYTLILSDGTKVILNSNSRLVFPQTFTGESREVELTGEAYFEVSKDSKHPFIVKSGAYKVKVYGTKFNMNCYDNSMKTFLLEGSVAVSIKNEEEKMLYPMQLASVNGDNLKIENVVESDTYLAWLSDNFVFNALPLDKVVGMLEQWYGVEFDKSFNINKPVFITGMFDRKINLPELIKLIEDIAEVEIINKDSIYHINGKDM